MSKLRRTRIHQSHGLVHVISKKQVRGQRREYSVDLDRVVSDMSLAVPGMQRAQLAVVVGLFNEGYSLPFIARYKQRETGPIEETKLRQIDQQFATLMEVETVRVGAIAAINDHQMLSAAMKEIVINQLITSTSVAEIKSVKSQHQPARSCKLRAALADSAALQAIDSIRACFSPTCAHMAGATNELRSHTQTLIGALWVLRDADVREIGRRVLTKHCPFLSSVKPHQWLAAKRRGSINSCFELTSNAIPDLLSHLHRALAPHSTVRISPRTVLQPHSCCRLVMAALQAVITECLLPAVRRSWIQQLDVHAEFEAMEYFKINLKNKMLQPGLVLPMLTTVIGIDPGLTSGCKAVALRNDHIIGMTKIHTCGFGDFLKQFDNILIVLGDGTGSLECQQFLACNLPEVSVCIVSESGASRYSISERAMVELPNVPVEFRGAVSIARRAIDPLSEYCKIDPQHLSVGMYQHDLNKKKLEKNLAKIVSECVAQVGVDLNTASESVLRCVPGLNKQNAKSIVSYRESSGLFKNRHELLQVKGIGPLTWRHSIGFLQIKNSNWTPMDATSIHPDDYSLANQIVKSNFEFHHLFSPNIPLHPTEPTDMDRHMIFSLLRADTLFGEPISVQQAKCFSMGSTETMMEELTVGIIIEGTVNNITAFGAFVNIGAATGAQDDGLLHISEYPKGFTNQPHFYKVNQKVKVKVLKISPETIPKSHGKIPRTKNRISLSARI